MVMMREESFIISLLSNMDVDPFFNSLSLTHSLTTVSLSCFYFQYAAGSEKRNRKFFFAFLLALYLIRVLLYFSCMPFPSLPQSRLIHSNKESAFNDDNGHDIFAPPNKYIQHTYR